MPSALLVGHIVVQALAWAILMPLILRYDIETKSPLYHSHLFTFVQGLSAALTLFATLVVAPKADGAEISVHGKLGRALTALLSVHFLVDRTLHFTKSRDWKVIRLFVVVLSGLYPLLAFAQLPLGLISKFDLCRDPATIDYCEPHYVIGGAFIIYGSIITTRVRLAEIRNVNDNKMSPRHFWNQPAFCDSLIFTMSGTYTVLKSRPYMADWTWVFTAKDLHTSIGLIWTTGGLLGVWFSWGLSGPRTANFIQCIMFILTGWAFYAHNQTSEPIRQVHRSLALCLGAAGCSRLFETILSTVDNQSDLHEGPPSIQYLPPLFTVASGILLIGAENEHVARLEAKDIPMLAYSTLLFSAGFGILLYLIILIDAREWLNRRLRTRREISVP